MFHLLLGRALMRWLEKIGTSETETAVPDASEPLSELVAEAKPEAHTADVKEPVEYVYPRVQRQAMGSLYEIYLAGTDREGLVAAGEEALNEIDRLDRQLSHYRDDSDITRLNRNAATQWVRVEPRLYRLLRRCCDLSLATDGAFDITAGPLIRAWGFFRGEGRVPSDEEIADLLPNVGFYRILTDDEDHLIYFTAPGLEINLGGIGKGYALDEAADILRAYQVRSAVLHGGQSTIYALGTPLEPDVESIEQEPATDDEIQNPKSKIQNPPGWSFTIKDPRDHETPICTVTLRDEALSTSGSYEQFFEVAGVRYSHIIDPLTGRPAQGRLSVSVIAASATESDALSTAFFVLGREATEEYCKAHPNIRAIMIEECADNEIEIIKIGFDEEVSA